MCDCVQSIFWICCSAFGKVIEHKIDYGVSKDSLGRRAPVIYGIPPIFSLSCPSLGH
jgi:hypothetical protein